MAQVTELPHAAIKPVWIWDITYEVGPGQTNYRPDVQLVQALINEVSTRLGLVDFRKGTPGPLGLIYPPLKQLNEDGWWGPETAAAVDSYQENALRRGGGVRDGRVDPVHPLLARLKGDPVGPNYIMGVAGIQRRTMFRLNADHVMLKGRMMDESEFPALLRADLKKKT